LQVLVMQRDFVCANLLGNYCFLMQKPFNTLRGTYIRPCDVNRCSIIRQIAMRLREGGETIAGEDYTHAIGNYVIRVTLYPAGNRWIG
jgi:hypothetical protein